MFSLQKKLSQETLLALKISSISLLVFIMILGGLIVTSYLYQTEKIRRDFIMEARGFEDIDTSPDGKMMIEGIISGEKGGPKKGRRGPRDILIFDQEKNILKNDLFDLDPDEIRKIGSLEKGKTNRETIDNTPVYIYPTQVGAYNIFLIRDLKGIEDFHIRLSILAFFATSIAGIIIYILSRYLARITIQPIREHNEALESYNHNVAHELKTPLAIMRSNLELLKLKPDEKFIDSTTEEVISMEKIIDTLLFLAKPKSEKDANEIIDPGKIIQSIIDEYRYSGIVFHVPKKKVKIRGNTELFKRILMNLIDNGNKYKSTGMIDIILKSDSLSITNHITQDIPQDELEKLTQTFYQGDHSHHTDGQGLGLALVKKIVDISGWELILESREKKFIAIIGF